MIFNDEVVQEDVALVASAAFFALFFGANTAIKIHDKIKNINKVCYFAGAKKSSKVPSYGYASAKDALIWYAYSNDVKDAEKNTLLLTNKNKSILKDKVYLCSFKNNKIISDECSTFEELCKSNNISIKFLNETRFKNRKEVYDKVIKLTKEAMKGNKIFLNGEFNTDEGNTDDFLNGNDNYAYIYYGDLYDLNNKKMVLKLVNDILKDINSRIPKGFKVSNDGNGDVDISLQDTNKYLSEQASTLSFNTKCDSIMYESLYEELMFDKIYNENKLDTMINRELILKESTSLIDKNNKLSTLYEAKIGDSIKAGWTKFLEFIKNIFGKFMEKITSIILNNKKYLEKYKDTILNKDPKDIEIEIAGDYETALQRMANHTIPVFSYSSHSSALKEEDDSDLLKIIIGSNFKYDGSKDTKTQIKDYFLGIDKGPIKKKLERSDLAKMYKYCYDADQIKSIKSKDITHLESSTNNINNAIASELSKNESYLFEAENDQQDDKKEEQPSNGGIKITDTGSYKDDKNPSGEDLKDNADAAKKDKEDNGEQDINAMIKKWIDMCRIVITAKMTALQQIAKDYFAVIRHHVKTHVGDKEANDVSKSNNDNKNNDNDQETKKEDKTAEKPETNPESGNGNK